MSARPDEAALDPDLRIVDAHHHLYDRPGVRYLADELIADLERGHRVEATVYVQARTGYRTGGPEAFRPVGETEYASEIARTRSRGFALCAAIVGFADLTAGASAQAVLEAHIAADPLRCRGVRQISCWDPDPSLVNPVYPAAPDMLSDTRFREGFAALGKLGLTFDAWLYFHQIPHLTALARTYPETGVVIDHCGGVLGVGRYEATPDEVRGRWAANMRDLARCPNVYVKLGGLGMAISGFGFDRNPETAGSEALVRAWKPWMEPLIEWFGPGRCMFESNFPADRISYGYVSGWNAFKRIAASASEDDKADLFRNTASRFYRLGSQAPVASS